MSSVWGADSAMAGSEDCRASEKCGRTVVSWCAIVLAPPQIIRLPFAIHLAADMQTWVALEQLRAAFIVAQMSAGGGLWLSGQVYAAVSTTMLRRWGEAAFAAYVCG